VNVNVYLYIPYITADVAKPNYW